MSRVPTGADKDGRRLLSNYINPGGAVCGAKRLFSDEDRAAAASVGGIWEEDVQSECAISVGHPGEHWCFLVEHPEVDGDEFWLKWLYGGQGEVVRTKACEFSDEDYSCILPDKHHGKHSHGLEDHGGDTFPAIDLTHPEPAPCDGKPACGSCHVCNYTHEAEEYERRIEGER